VLTLLSVLSNDNNTLRDCHHEGCNKKVHRRCQEDWLDRHCYPWTHEDPHFCREHNEHYIKWVKFKGGEIPHSENGCVPGSFLNPTVENPVRSQWCLEDCV
jgi:hypothetical protein